MATEITNNESGHQYEIHVDGELAGFIRYRIKPEAITLVHTEVFAAFEGQGLAGQLARFALDDLRAKGVSVVPQCPYVAAYIKKHPEYADLVAA